MLKLLPCLAGLEADLKPDETGSNPDPATVKPDPESERISFALQFHLAETIKSLLRTEKNQQVNASQRHLRFLNKRQSRLASFSLFSFFSHLTYCVFLWRFFNMPVFTLFKNKICLKRRKARGCCFKMLIVFAFFSDHVRRKLLVRHFHRLQSGRRRRGSPSSRSVSGENAMAQLF